MTKKELVEKLKEYPDDMKVYVGGDYEGAYTYESILREAGEVYVGSRATANSAEHILCITAKSLINIKD